MPSGSADDAVGSGVVETGASADGVMGSGAVVTGTSGVVVGVLATGAGVKGVGGSRAAAGPGVVVSGAGAKVAGDSGAGVGPGVGVTGRYASPGAQPQESRAMWSTKSNALVEGSMQSHCRTSVGWIVAALSSLASLHSMSMQYASAFQCPHTQTSCLLSAKIGSISRGTRTSTRSGHTGLDTRSTTAERNVYALSAKHNSSRLTSYNPEEAADKNHAEESQRSWPT